MPKRMPVVLTSVAAIIAIGGAWAAATQAPRRATPMPTPKQATKAQPTTVAARTIAGPVEGMKWGKVQVTLLVKGKHIDDVRATAPMDRPRSAFINGVALPILRREVLRAQSAHIDGISGATMTSDAYRQSLRGALARM